MRSSAAPEEAFDEQQGRARRTTAVGELLRHTREHTSSFFEALSTYEMTLPRGPRRDVHRRRALGPGAGAPASSTSNRGPARHATNRRRAQSTAGLGKRRARVRGTLGLVFGELVRAGERFLDHPRIRELYPEYLFIALLIRASVPLMESARERAAPRQPATRSREIARLSGGAHRGGGRPRRVAAGISRQSGSTAARCSPARPLPTVASARRRAVLLGLALPPCRAARLDRAA